MIRRLLTGLVFMLFVGTASAQYRVDRLITAGRSALYYEDYVLSIKYFNLAIGAKPYLYEPWYYRSDRDVTTRPFPTMMQLSV